MKYLFYISIICSLLSQASSTFDNFIGIALKMTWILPMSITVLRYKRIFLVKESVYVYSFLFLITSYCITLHGLTNYNYLQVDLMNMIMSVCIIATSMAFWYEYGSKDTLETICGLLLAGGLFLTIDTYFTFLRGYDINNPVYAFDSKNSMGQILFCCALIPFVHLDNKNLHFRIIESMAILLMVFVIFLMKTRATILCIFFVSVYYIFISKDKNKRKIFLLLSILTLLYFVFNPMALYTIVESILFASQDPTDVNSLSSNRVDLISEAIDIISAHYWFGVGNRYLDCMPIAMILQFGIVGASIVFAFLFKTAKVIHCNRKSNYFYEVVFLLFYSYILNSLFEAQPPFGPGAKCFLLWMFFGFMLSSRYTKNRSFMMM